MKLAAIVAMTPDRVIGRDNQIPWYLPADLKYFKKVTTGHPVIMGRKCFQSIGRPLPKRTNIVLTRNPFFIATGVVIANDRQEGLEAARQTGAETAFIIGGAHIYELYWEQTSELYVTVVHTDAQGDVYFPVIDPSVWELTREQHHEPHGKNEFAYTYQHYRRKSPATS